MDLRHQQAPLLFILQKRFRRLGEYESDQKLTTSMQKVLVHITQHPSARLKIVKRVLQPLGVTPALKGGGGRVGDGNLEADGRIFLGYECLGYES